MIMRPLGVGPPECPSLSTRPRRRAENLRPVAFRKALELRVEVFSQLFTLLKRKLDHRSASQIPNNKQPIYRTLIVIPQYRTASGHVGRTHDGTY